MAKLPQGWVECQLKDIGDIVAGGTPSTKDADNFGGNIAWITPADLSDYKEKFISHGKRNITEIGLKNSSAKLMPKGAILFSSRAPIGYTVIASNPICTNQGFKNIVPSKYVFNEYIYYYLKNSKSLVEKYSSGTTFKEISGTKFGLIPFPLPPYNEQKRIVEKIESEFAKIDEGLEHLEQAKEQIKQYRQSVLKSAFEGKLYKTSEWEIGELKKFCLKVNKRKISNNEQEEFFYIDISSIDNKNNILLSATKYNGKNAPSRARQIVKSEDILFSTVRTYLKNIAIVPPEYDNEIASTGFCVIRTNSNLLYSKFMFYKSLSDKFLEPLNKLQRGSSYPAVRDNDVLSQIICIPHSIEEQKKIVEEIEKRFAVVDDVEKVVEENIEKAKQLKQSILKKAFEGRLVPQDPTDEPASTLLEKIKQERSKKK